MNRTDLADGFEWENDGAGGSEDLPEIVIRDLDDLPEDVRKRIEEEGTIGEGVDLVKGVRPMFGSPGGKRFLAKQIVAMFPKHETYIEAFVGGGAVFFAKAKDASTKEIIGDGDPEIAAAYKFLQGATDDQIVKLRKMPMRVDRGTHKAIRAQKAIPTDPVARFHKFWYMTRCSMFKQRNKSFNVGDEGKDLSPAIDRIPTVKDRLAGVAIKSGDFRKTIAAGDGPNTLIYLDPPYEGTIWDGPMLSTDDFLGAVQKMKGMVVASHIGHPEVVKKFKAAGLSVKIVEVRRGVGNVRSSQGGETTTQMAKEIIATNFDRAGKRLVKDDAEDFTSESGPLLDAGAHQHDLDPAAGQTEGDGSHMHLFALLDGVMLFTNEDGAHVHPIPAAADAMDKPSGSHKHTLTLPDGTAVETAEGAPHVHDLLGMTTAIDGVHVHDLVLPTGDKITSLSPSGHRRIETGAAPAAAPDVEAKKNVPINFAEGDEGEGVLQIHERGIREEVLKKIPSVAFGLDVIEVGPASIARLGKVVPGDWSGVFATIAKGGSGSDVFDKLAGLAEQAIAKATDEIDRRAIYMIDPISIHTDIRLRKMLPYPVNYWQGGEILTPGHQFRSNAILGMEAGETIPMRFQIQKGQEIARGSLPWMDMGADDPAVFGPGEIGDTAGYSRFRRIEKFAWKAGIQTPTTKEFWFDGEILKGRFLIRSAEDGSIVFDRPADQKMASPIFEADGEIRKTVVPICKVEEEKRIVVGPVLIPDVVDAQGDRISAEAIEAAAHEFLERLNKATQAGVMHRFFDKDLRVVESFIAPQDLTYGDRVLTKGTWVMATHVIDDGTWDRIRSKEIKGYSIGGVAQAVRNVTAGAAE